MSVKILLSVGALAVFMALPIWKDMHHQGKSQSGWGFVWEQLVLKERAKHIHVEEAVINAKARYSLGLIPGAG